MRKLKFWLPTALLAVLLSGCDGNDNAIPPQPVPQTPATSQPVTVEQQPQVVYEQAPQQQPQVVVVEQQPKVVYRDNPSSGGITAGHLAAGALGYMAGKHLSGNSSSRSRNYAPSRKTVVNNYYRPAPTKRSYYGSSSRRSSFGRGRRR